MIAPLVRGDFHVWHASASNFNVHVLTYCSLHSTIKWDTNFRVVAKKSGCCYQITSGRQ